MSRIQPKSTEAANGLQIVSLQCRSYDVGMPIPDNITRNHVEAAVADYNAGVPHRFSQSTGYDLLYESRRYPPKAILGLAAKHATGILLVPKAFKSHPERIPCFLTPPTPTPTCHLRRPLITPGLRRWRRSARGAPPTSFAVRCRACSVLCQDKEQRMSVDDVLEEARLLEVLTGSPR